MEPYGPGRCRWPTTISWLSRQAQQKSETLGNFGHFSAKHGKINELKHVKMKKNQEEPLVFKMLIPQHTAPSLRIDHQIAIRVETEMCSRIGSWFKATSTICTGPTLPNDVGPDGLTLVISLVKCQISMPPQQGTTFRAWQVKDLGTIWYIMVL